MGVHRFYPIPLGSAVKLPPFSRLHPHIICTSLVLRLQVTTSVEVTDLYQQEDLLMQRQRNSLVVLLLPLLIGSQLAFAQGRTSVSQQQAVNTADKTDELGVGLQVGSLSGVNFEYWTAPERTINSSLTAERGNFVVGASHNWIYRDAFSGQFRNFRPFIGAGVLAAWGDRSGYFRRDTQTFGLAAQMPLGIEFLPSMQRFAVFAEIAPSLQVIPASIGFLTGDIGARFYF